VASVRGCVARHDHGVPLAGRDLVIATGAAVRLGRLVGLHAAHVDAVVGVVGELVVDHRRARRLAEERPGEERGDHDERGGDDREVAAVLHAHSERVVAHGGTVAGRRCNGGVAGRPGRRSGIDPR